MYAGKPLEESPARLADRDIGIVELVPLRPLFLEEQKECGALGEWAGVRQYHVQQP